MSTSENLGTRPKRRWLRWVLISLASIISVCIVGIALLFYIMLRPYEMGIPQLAISTTSDSGDVSLAFMYRLMRHEREAAKEITQIESWPDIDKWMRIHQPISSCTTTLSNDVDGNFGGGGTFRGDSSEDTAEYSWTYFCFGSEWIVEFDDIKLRKIDGNWKVISWKASKGRY